MNKTIEDRKKNMLRLMLRYSKQVSIDSNWVLPYVWNIRYKKQTSYTVHDIQYICYTSDLAFAAMIFTAWCLQEDHEVVTVISMELSGFENEFTKIMDHDTI